MRSQTEIFSKLVKDFMRPSPLVIPAGTSCRKTVTRMAEEKSSCALIADGSGRLVGIVTEQDVTARIAYQVEGHSPIDDVMTRSVQTISEDDYLYHAIARMRRRKLRHMPVLGDQGAIVGMVDLHDALAKGSEQLMRQLDRLTAGNSLEGLKEVKSAQVELAEELFADGLGAPDIQSLLTHINNDIYRRIVNQRLKEMESEGWGPAPVDFTVIVMGSGGRGENYLYPDQDNGFILGDYPDSEHNRIDKFFIELAERMCRDLNAVGLPYCNGYCMAMNPIWRKSLSQWYEQMNLWCRKHNFVAIRLSDIFFDFQPVWGNMEMAHQLRDYITETVQRHHFFLREMYEEEKDHNVALSFFGGLSVEKDTVGHEREVNLKHNGTIPLVESTRLLALKEGVRHTSTLKRLKALFEKEVLDRTEYEDLVAAHKHISGLLLNQQLHDFGRGKAVSNYISPNVLSDREKKALIGALKAVDNLKKKVRTDFTADIF